MTGVDFSQAAIELSPAQIRAAKVDANRRALAALLHHHGDRPPERDCSAEARRIRHALADAACARQAAASELPADALTRKIDVILDEVAARHDVTREQLLNPPRRPARRPHEHRAQLAYQEAMYRCYREACRSLRSLGRHFGKDYTSIRRAVGQHAARVGAGEPTK